MKREESSLHDGAGKKPFRGRPPGPTRNCPPSQGGASRTSGASSAHGKSPYADLHIHTTASDGCLPPKEVVQLAAREGFAAISICDHDTVAGLPEGIAAAEKAAMELIPGLELGSYLGESEVHILGYCLDYDNPFLRKVLSRLCEERLKRANEMIRLLGEMGVSLDRTGIDRAAAFGSVGRMHLARALAQQGFVDDTKEAFARYIGRGKPAYVPRGHFSPAEACATIVRAGGIPVLAHPSQLESDNLIPRLVKAGIMGIEAFYSTVDPQLAEHYCSLAEKWGLLITGGSDCHQSDPRYLRSPSPEPPIGEYPLSKRSHGAPPQQRQFLIGTVKLDYEYVKKLKAAATSLRGRKSEHSPKKGGAMS